MRATRCPNRIRNFLVLSAVLAAFAAPGAASAQTQPPSAGSSQTCIGVGGGFVVEITGFGDHFPADTTGTTTFTFANGDVVVTTGTTNFEGIVHTEPFIVDIRDPELAALVGTSVHETASFGGFESTLDFELVGCPTAPDGRVACMDGGFENYPALGFLNQGDCVSWIATNGKNEPGKNVP